MLYPQGDRKYEKELTEAVSELGIPHILDGSKLNDMKIINCIKDLEPEIGVCAFFGYLIPVALFNNLNSGCINVHTGYLPYNRGAHPNVWPIIDGSPAGVTVHFMDTRIDIGDIIAQHLVDIALTDTSGSLCRKLERSAVGLFREVWPLVASGCVLRVVQDKKSRQFS